MGIRANNLTGYQVEIQAGDHRLIADEPIGVGDNAGPNPYDLLLGALAACKIMTVRMYALRKGWPLERVEIRLSTHEIHARDRNDCESDPKSRIEVIQAEISFKGDLTPGQLQRLAEMADRCPVHRTLTGEIKICTDVVE